MKTQIFFSCLFFAQLLLKVSSIQLRQAAGGAAVQANNAAPANNGNEATINAFCFLNNDGTVYDLNGLAYPTADYKLTLPTGVIDFNICRNAVNPCTGKVGVASFTPTVGGQCYEIAGDYAAASTFNILNDGTLQMVLPPGDACASDPNQNYQTTVEFTCDPNATVPAIKQGAVNANLCVNDIAVTSSVSCPQFNVYSLWNNIQANKWVFGFIIIAAGVFFCFFGENFVKVVEVMAGAAVVLILILYFVFNYITVALNSWQFWLIILLAVAAGCLAGWFLSYLTWLPGVILGGLLGFVAGFFIYNVALRYIQSNPTAVFWTVMVVCVALGCFVAWFIEEEILIIATSVVGAYAIMRGFSIWIGGFPDERQVYELAQNQEWDQLKTFLTPAVYGYLAAFLVIAACGMYIQFKYFYNEEEKAKKKKEKAEKKEKEKEKLKEEEK